MWEELSLHSGESDDKGGWIVETGGRRVVDAFSPPRAPTRVLKRRISNPLLGIPPDSSDEQ